MPESSSSRRRRGAPYPRQIQNRVSASPVPTNISSTTTISTRSRQQLSRSLSGADPSPEKKSVTSSGSGSRKGKEKAIVPLPVADIKPRVEYIAPDDEEGEPELDISDTITVNGNDASSASPEKPEVEEAPKKEPVIRLVVGEKRKPPAQEEEKADEEKIELEDDVKGDGGKRAVRKKRKWLKKGEGELCWFLLVHNADQEIVDPDDPIAVARQKERHKVIDE